MKRIESDPSLSVDSLPEGYLYPGTNPRQCLTPENAYMLEHYDILAGLDSLFSKMPKRDASPISDFPIPDSFEWEGSLELEYSILADLAPFFSKMPERNASPIRYFIMPNCFRWVFEKGTQRPLHDSSYLEMQETLKALMRDAQNNSKVPVVIAGIVNFDENHYVNYFCTWNPKKNKVEIFLLDPSAEVQKGSKKSTELHYGTIIWAMLVHGMSREEPESGPDIEVRSFSVTQQLRERDCGFLCLQNLEDMLYRGLFSLNEEAEFCVDLRALTVNGNTGRAYDQSQAKYCYRSQIIEQDLQVRQTWARRMMGAPGVPRREIRFYSMNSNPTLNDKFEVFVGIEDYDYSASVERQFNNDILGVARSQICQLFQSLQKDGKYVFDACVERYTHGFNLPSDLEIAEYTQQLRELMKPIKIQAREYTVDDLDTEFGALDYVVYDSILALFSPHHGTAILCYFESFFRQYKWPQSSANWEQNLWDSYFADEKLQPIIRLLKPEEFSVLRESCEKMYRNEVSRSFLISREDLVTEMRYGIFREEDPEKLYQTFAQHCKFIIGPEFQKKAEEFISEVKKPIKERVGHLLRDEMREIIPKICNELLAEDLPLIRRLRLAPSRWRSLIYSDAKWKVFIDRFPNTLKPFLETIDNKIEKRIQLLLIDSIDMVLMEKSDEQLRALLNSPGNSHENLWKILAEEILHLEVGEAVPLEHQQYYVQRLSERVSRRLHFHSNDFSGEVVQYGSGKYY